LSLRFFDLHKGPPMFTPEDLPESNNGPYSCYTVKQNEYVTLALFEPLTGKVVLTANLHQVEARKLAERILKIIASECREEIVEGIYLGGLS
jgi:hypothetical protein